MFKGEGYKKISKAVLISQNTVAKVMQKFKKDGIATVSQRSPGRPRKLTPRRERLLMRSVEEHQAESQTRVSVSRDTIRHTLQRNGKWGGRPLRKPLLKPELARTHAEKDEDTLE
uniref:Transposase Tc1-like domain-containing protein n=1 Tax=Paramormyrops kingsleyae TaxID=1676925 RepID=A0A3B3QJY2_9TELE